MIWSKEARPTSNREARIAFPLDEGWGSLVLGEGGTRESLKKMTFFSFSIFPSSIQVWFFFFFFFRFSIERMKKLMFFMDNVFLYSIGGTWVYFNNKWVPSHSNQNMPRKKGDKGKWMLKEALMRWSLQRERKKKHYICTPWVMLPCSRDLFPSYPLLFLVYPLFFFFFVFLPKAFGH